MSRPNFLGVMGNFLAPHPFSSGSVHHCAQWLIQNVFQAVFNTMSSQSTQLSTADISEAIKMAWEDRTSFETIEEKLGINESTVIKLMRTELTPSSFKMWRERMRGRKTKHRKLRSSQMKYADKSVADHRRANC